MERPADFYTEPGYDVNEAARGVVVVTRRQTPSVEKKSLRINTKKIQRFRNAFAAKREPSFVEKENSKNRLDSRSRTASDADRKLGILQVIIIIFIYTRGGRCQYGLMCGCKQWSNDRAPYRPE